MIPVFTTLHANQFPYDHVDARLPFPVASPMPIKAVLVLIMPLTVLE